MGYQLSERTNDCLGLAKAVEVNVKGPAITFPKKFGKKGNV